LEIPPEP
jgi:hypothetical protein